MFENSGEKIKKIAVIMFWITVVISVILAFVFGWQTYHFTYSSGTYKAFEPLYFFSFLIGGPLVSYVSTLFLVAFGELVQNIQQIKESSQHPIPVMNKNVEENLKDVLPEI